MIKIAKIFFFFQIEGLDGCVVYNYDPLDSNINVVQILKFDNRLLDFSIDGDSVIFLTHTKVIIIFKFESVAVL